MLHPYDPLPPIYTDILPVDPPILIDPPIYTDILPVDPIDPIDPWPPIAICPIDPIEPWPPIDYGCDYVMICKPYEIWNFTKCGCVQKQQCQSKLDCLTGVSTNPDCIC